MISYQSPLRVEIGSYEIQSGVTYYCLTVRTQEGPAKSWTLQKRFSHFDDLHNKLLKRFPDIPPRPKKTWFKMKRPIELEQRRKDLEDFANRLLARKDLFYCDLFQAFLGVDTHLLEYVVKEEPTIGLVSKQQITWPVSHLICDEQANAIISVELKVNKGVPASPTHDDVDGLVSAESLIKLFEIKHSLLSDKPFDCSLKWSARLGERINCIKYNSVYSTMACGTETGMVYMQKTLKTNDLLECNSGMAAHSEAVTSMCFEENLVYIVSVGLDKKVVGTSLDGKTLFSAKLGDYPLTGIRFDAERCHVLISNTHGEVFVCDVQSVKMELLRVLKVADNQPILALEASFGQHLFACLFPDEVRWFSYETGKETEGSVLGRWKSAEKIRSMALHGARNVLIVGDKCGRLKFLDLPTGEVKLTLKCHEKTVRAVCVESESGTLVSSSKDCPMAVRRWPLL